MINLDNAENQIVEAQCKHCPYWNSNYGCMYYPKDTFIRHPVKNCEEYSNQLNTKIEQYEY